MDFSNYKFRCSALGNLVSASGKFTDGNKTYIREVFIGALNNVRKEVTSKYFEKGLFEEESGISLLNDTLYRGQLCVKNKERKQNDYIHGEADCIKGGYVYDIKNAWDVFTFGNASLTHNYRWQLIGYMWLWEMDKARLFYCLNDTPEHILATEERRLFYAGNYVSIESPDYIEDCRKLREKHVHSHRPLWERFKVFDVERADEDIERLKASINQARAYMDELYAEHTAHVERNMELMGYTPSIFTAQHDASVGAMIVE